MSKYEKWYYALMEAAKNRIFHDSSNSHDVHHILPRSLGGQDDPSNLVLLTAREHYLAHLLLLKFTTGRDRSKMACALFRFSPKGSSRYGNGRKYDRLRKSMSQAMSGENNPFFGKKHTDETRKKISGENHGMYGKGCYDVWLEKYGKERADELRRQMNNRRSQTLSGENNPMYGKKHTEERNKSHSQSLMGRKGMFKDGKQKRVKPEDFQSMLDEGWRFKENS